MVDPNTVIAIETEISAVDSESIYRGQLETTGWTIHPEYRLSTGFTIAIDANDEMMIAFCVEEDDFVIEIMNYDAGLLESVGIDQSPTWPQEVIDAHFGFATETIIPVFPSSEPYFYIPSSLEVEALMIFTEVAEDAVDDYAALLTSMNWGSFVNENEETIYTDSSEQIILVLGYDSGFATIAMINNVQEPELPEPDTMTWPIEALNEEFGATLSGLVPVLNSSFGYLVDHEPSDGFSNVYLVALGVTDPEFEYYRGMLGNQSFTVTFAEGVANENCDPYVAVDSENRIMLLMYLSDIGVEMDWVLYDDELYHYWIDEGSGGETAGFWPHEAINERFDITTGNIVPEFSDEEIYSVDDFTDEAHDILWTLITAETGTPNTVRAYVSSLETANWSADILEDEETGSYIYLMVDPTQTVLMKIYFYDGEYPFVEFWITDYSLALYDEEYESMFGGTESPAWPDEALMAMFDGYTIPSYEFSGAETLEYNVNEVAHTMTITIGNCGPGALDAYIATLDAEYFHTYVNYENAMAVTTNPSGNLDVYISFYNQTLTLEVRSIDYGVYEEYFSTYIEESSDVFPNMLIEMHFGDEMPDMLLPYVSESPFVFYTEWFLGVPTVHIEVASSQLEFENYYAALDGSWDMEGSTLEGVFEATQTGHDVFVEVEFDSVNQITTIEISRQTIK
jgi:hypothetical protein